MQKYVILINWTEQGVANARDTVDRYHAAKQAWESAGGTFDLALWTLGAYDLVAVVSAPDAETVAAFGLRLGAAGNLRTTILRAFDESEMAGIVGTLG